MRKTEVLGRQGVSAKRLSHGVHGQMFVEQSFDHLQSGRDHPI
jgi:hypothetical protein